MADLPARPSLDHLRRRARDLLRAARAGDTTAVGRLDDLGGFPNCVVPDGGGLSYRWTC